MNLNPKKNNFPPIPFNCDKCNKREERKYNFITKKYSKINEIDYWTDNKGWKNFKLICKECLKDWAENNRESFVKLVSKKKRITFSHYKTQGIFNKAKKYNL